MTGAGRIVVDDHLASMKADVYGEVLHADVRITASAPGHFDLEGVGGSLQASVAEPTDVNESIERNIVMGPGKPGSVQKGSLEGRGERLVVNTKAAHVSDEFIWDLSF
jgi:hypothetical protein